LAEMEQKMIALQLEINNRGQIQAMKEEGSSRRKLMDVISRAYNTDTINEAKVNQTNIKANADQNKTELDVILKLILAGLPAEMLKAEIHNRDKEQERISLFAEHEVNQTDNPFIAAGKELLQAPLQAPQPMQQPIQQPMPPGSPLPEANPNAGMQQNVDSTSF